MTDYFIGNFATGRELVSLPVLKGPWTDRLHVAETVSVTVDLNDPDIQALGLGSAATPAQAYLCVEENGVLRGGPIWTRNYSRTSRQLTLGAAGAASYFDHRLIMPLLAATIGVDQWTVPDPDDDTKTIPNPLLSTVVTNLSLATRAKRLIQQARLWTGGNVPIVFQDDEIDDNDHTYLGTDFKPVWEAISDIMNLEGGPEIALNPRRTSDGGGVEWLLRTGTIDEPLITSSSVLSWNVTVPESPVSNLTTTEDATAQGSLAWLTGGEQTDDVLVSRAYDDTLLEQNFALLELLDTTHPDVSLQTTLDGYSRAAVLAGKSPSEVWSFTVKAYAVDQDNNKSAPWIGDYSLGDFFDLEFDDWDPDTGIGDPYLPGGTYRMRVIGISGDELAVDIKIDCAPLVRAS